MRRTCAALVLLAFCSVADGDAQQRTPPDLSGHWDRTSPIVSFANVPTGARQ